MNTRNIKIDIDYNLTNDFLERRKNEGFTELTLKNESIILDNFMQYLNLNDIDTFSIIDINNYLSEIKCNKVFKNKTQTTLIRLYDFIKTGHYNIVNSKKAIIHVNSRSNECIENYLQKIVNKQDYTTIMNKRIFLKLFFAFLEEKNVYELSEIKKNYINEFLSQCLKKYSKAYFNKIAYFIREYLNYLYKANEICFTGHDVIPKLNSNGQRIIPTTYKGNEIKKLLLCVDKSSNVGKRDYLILILLSTYGIRIGDICSLKIKSFNFNQNKISFVQNKTKKRLELPLFDETKYALIDYLKNARPKCDSDYVFITFTKPYRKYDKRGFRDIVPKYLKLANIDTVGKKRGAHTLRHSLASNMLLNGSSMKTISDVLGHTYLNTSDTYLTIDSKKMQELALELPIGGITNE